MPDLREELVSALEAVESVKGKENCNCQQQASTSSEEPFGQLLFDPGAALDAALDALTNATSAETALLGSLAPLDELEFADIATESDLQLQDLLGLIEKYPGLKITLSY